MPVETPDPFASIEMVNAVPCIAVLSGTIGGECPEIPLHVVVAQAAVGAPLLRADEMLELHRIAHEENRRIVPHHVVVALPGVELQRKAARVAPGVGAAAFDGDRGKSDQRVGPRPGLKHGGLDVGADVFGHLEKSEGPSTFGVRLAIGNFLPFEVGHLLDQVMVL